MAAQESIFDEVAMLKKRIQELEDIQKVQNVISRYCLNFDFGRPESVIKLFTEDCVFATDAQGEMLYRRGKDALKEAWMQPRPFTGHRSQHLQMDLVTTVEGDTAHVYNYQVMRADKEGEIDINRCALRSVTLHRVDGEWLIHELYSVGVNNDEQVQKTLPAEV